MQIAQKVKDALTDIVASMGFEVYEVTYKRGVSDMELTIYIVRGDDALVTLEDCEAVSVAVEPIIDELDPTNGASFSLSVSSLGIDWEIKTERDFARNRGKMVEIRLYQKHDGVKEFVGELLDWDENNVTINASLAKSQKAKKSGVSVPCEKLTFPRKEIAKIAPYIDF